MIVYRPERTQMSWWIMSGCFSYCYGIEHLTNNRVHHGCQELRALASDSIYIAYKPYSYFCFVLVVLIYLFDFCVVLFIFAV